MSVRPLCQSTAKKPPSKDYEFIRGSRPGSGILVITVGKKSTGYAVAELSVGTTPGRGFTLVKSFGGTDKEVDRYDVFITAVAGPGHSDHCSCRGFNYRGYCKHVEALRSEFFPTVSIESKESTE